MTNGPVREPTGRDPVVAGPPSSIGAYDLLSVIGSGGMGDVYRARDRRTGEDCALKVLRLEGDNLEERIRRFENEVAAIRTLDHPGIVAVRDAGSEGSFHYLAMDLIEGRSYPVEVFERAEGAGLILEWDAG